MSNTLPIVRNNNLPYYAIRIMPTPMWERKLFGYGRYTVVGCRTDDIGATCGSAHTLNQVKVWIDEMRDCDKININVLIKLELLNGDIVLDTDEDWIMAILSEHD